MMQKCALDRGSSESKGSEEEPDCKFEEEKDRGRVVLSRCGHSVVNRRGSRNRVIQGKLVGWSLGFIQCATGSHCRVMGREVRWSRTFSASE